MKTKTETKFQTKIKIQNVEVYPGDIIYASNDGVIRVKKKDFYEAQIIKVIKKNHNQC